MIENKQIMARNILKYMERDNIKATDICNTLHFKQSTFSDWVNAKTYPRIDAIEKLCIRTTKKKIINAGENHKMQIDKKKERKIMHNSDIELLTS